jgi:hypothetical protein
MDDNWVVGKLVEVWYRRDEYGGGGCDGGEFSGADWGENREQRVGILSHGLNLYKSQDKAHLIQGICFQGYLTSGMRLSDAATTPWSLLSA